MKRSSGKMVRYEESIVRYELVCIQLCCRENYVQGTVNNSRDYNLIPPNKDTKFYKKRVCLIQRAVEFPLEFYS